MTSLPPFIAPAAFDDAAAALVQVRAIYDGSVAHLRGALQRFVAGEDLAQRVRACYPFVRVRTDTVARADSRLSYGFVAGPGSYETTLTRPDLFANYLLDQFRLLLRNHGVVLEVGTSTQPIPVHFSFADDEHIEGSLSAERRLLLRDRFDLPDLAAMDDGIANGTHEPRPGEAHPLSLFTAPRVDYSLRRLRHYSGTRPEHFQNFVLFTNYQFYIDEFVRLGHECMQDAASAYTAFVEPGDLVTPRIGLAAQTGNGVGAALTSEITSQVGSFDFTYLQTNLAGGLNASASGYAGFLRRMLRGEFVMSSQLGSRKVCASSACTAGEVLSPAPPDEAWNYSLGHWVEDDPKVGDHAFSSAGALGFYPWIDSTKTWYGIVARRATSAAGQEGVKSMDCGRLIRQAWVTGVQVTGTTPTP